MIYTYTNYLGETLQFDSVESIKDIIDNTPFTEWEKGSGDASISIADIDEQLIFFKVNSGVFIMQHPDYLAPIIKENYNNINTIKHYVGGEPMSIPDVCVCSDDEAFKIIKNFIIHRLLDKDYTWTDIYALDFDHGF